VKTRFTTVIGILSLLAALSLSGCKTKVDRGGTPSGSTTSTSNPTPVNPTNGGGGPGMPTQSTASPTTGSSTASSG
jgi:hypothetical protein